MVDNVSFKVGVDAAAAHKEMERMRDEIASLRNGIEKLTEKSKQGGRAGRDAYKSMGDEMASMITRTVGVTAVYAKMLQSIQAVIEKTKELRALRDESAVSLDASLNKVNKEFQLKGTDQDKMRGFLQGGSQAEKMKISDYAEITAQIGNEGGSKESVYSGKYKSIYQLKNATGAEGADSVNLVQTGLRRDGKDLDSASEEDIRKLSKLFATSGRDVAGLSTGLSKLDKKIPIDEAIALIEMGNADRFGKDKASVSALNEGYKKGGIKGAIKATGGNQQEYESRLSRKRKDTETYLSSSNEIQKSSREGDVAFSENALQFATAESIQGEETQSAQMKRRKAKDETDRKNNLSRTIDDTLGSNYGEENIGTVKGYATEGLFRAVPSGGSVFQLIKAITGTNKKIDLQNASMSQGLGKESINTKNDSKGVR